MNTSFAIIVAVDKDLGIGRNGLLPWGLPGEISHFKEVTTAPVNDYENVVIMGRKTWDSIPQKFRPLSKRINVILTRDLNNHFPKEVLKAVSLDGALELLRSSVYKNAFGKIFVIGGAELFKLAIDHPECHEIFLTHINASFDCDRFFPSLPDTFKEASRSVPILENGIEYSFAVYKR